VLVTGSGATAELFDIRSSTFLATGTALGAARVHHTATLLGSGEVLIFGGGGATAGAEFFEPN
jgi:hypothetical protein